MSASYATIASWNASLELGFERRCGRTALVRRTHRGPLLVQRPFYPEGDVCHCYIVHPPGGVVGGDSLTVDATVAADAHALITTPASAKFYRSAGARAIQTQQLRCAGTLEWLPQDTIFYPGALVRSHTEIHLETAARFIGWDVVSLGLATRNERFASGQLSLNVELWRSGEPVYLDRLQIAGGSKALDAPWGWHGYTCLGTLLACPARNEWLDGLRTIAVEDGLLGITCVDDVLVVRCLGRRSEPVRHALIRAWQMLRPWLLMREPVLPRIWAT
ncbi:MAG TPA: urease accessory protein UreD [Steroidobacteraceae bacterium]|jgi:urease accessory protein